MPEILIGKFMKRIFQSDKKDYHVFDFRVSGGKHIRAVIDGTEAPKPLKTVEFTVFGDYYDHPKYGKNLRVTKFERFAGMSQARKSERAVEQIVQRIMDEPAREETQPVALVAQRKSPNLPAGTVAVVPNMQVLFDMSIGELEAMKLDVARRDLRIAASDVAESMLALDQDQSDEILRTRSMLLLDAATALKLSLSEARKAAQRDGIEKAKAQGIYKGRKANPDLHALIIAHLDQGHGVRGTARAVGCSTTTVLKVRDKDRNSAIEAASVTVRW